MPVRLTCDWRSASIGRIWPARRQASAAPITATQTPVIRTPAIVASTSGDSWIRNHCGAACRATSQRASNGPPARPISEPIVEAASPISTASASTIVLICWGVPPASRNNASSRWRWFTEKAKVAPTRKVETTAARPPVTPSRPVTDSSASRSSARVGSASCRALPVSTSSGRLSGRLRFNAAIDWRSSLAEPYTTAAFTGGLNSAARSSEKNTACSNEVAVVTPLTR